MSTCGLVYPVWVQIGTVQWNGAPERERLYTTERITCGRTAGTKMYRGVELWLCPVHAAEAFQEVK